jgi:putative lipoic acid-binding regulatory protein
MSGQFEALAKQLEKEEWPSVYFFKFISPSDNATIAKITSLFKTESAVSLRASSNGNYTSISVKEVMVSPSEVIAIYEKVASFKGVIIL